MQDSDPDTTLAPPRPRVGSASRPRLPPAVVHRPGAVLRRRDLRQAAARLFAEFGAASVGLPRVAQAAGMAARAACHYWGNRDELLFDLLDEHALGLRLAVCTAFDATEGQGAAARLEAIVQTWLDYLATHRDEHRCLLFCAHLLAPERRDSVRIRQEVTMETMMEPVLAGEPALADRAEPVARLTALFAALLNDLSFWPTPPEPAERVARGRAITGMIRAAAMAEAEGSWAGLGAHGTPVKVESRRVRRQWGEVVRAVALGQDVLVTRRGKRVARVVGVG